MNYCTRKLISNIYYGKISIFQAVRWYRSGYRLTPEKCKSKKLDENKSESEIFDEHVQQCMLHKARSPLRGFERGDMNANSTLKPLPNEKFYNGYHLPRYGSYSRYRLEAERERRRQSQKGVHWNTMDYWWKKDLNEPKYVDIGMDVKDERPTRKEIRAIIRSNVINENMEKEARHRTLELDVDENMEEWETSGDGALAVNNIAHHYAVFRDLFGHAHFHPTVNIDIAYPVDDDSVNPVYYGNDLSPSEVNEAPFVTFDSNPDDLWSIVLVNLDGNLEDNQAEYVHWMVGNVPGSDVASGDVIIDYMMPLPARGTGFHRLVFLLFKQREMINFCDEQRQLPCLLLRQRHFKTRNFYKKYEQLLTPSSLRFFQTKWEPSVQDAFHKLGIAEPVYEFSKPTERLGRLSDYPDRKTLTWLSKFYPKEPIFPGGGQFT